MTMFPLIGPLSSGAIRAPCVIIATMMTNMLMRANVLAFASFKESVHVNEKFHSEEPTFAISLYKDKG